VAAAADAVDVVARADAVAASADARVVAAAPDAEAADAASDVVAAALALSGSECPGCHAQVAVNRGAYAVGARRRRVLIVYRHAASSLAGRAIDPASFLFHLNVRSPAWAACR
jgi:hypothetical protein